MTQNPQDKLRIGIVGCGDISVAYLRNAPLFRGVEMIACCDLNPEVADSRARAFNIRAAEIDAVMQDPEVDLILNLTVPNAHFDVSMMALSAGKHVFTEKPLAVQLDQGRVLVAEAERRGLSIGSAPDTFLGAAGRHARMLMDADAIGRPILGTAFMFGHGMEHVHPNPGFYYQRGAGPVLDMGPYYITGLVNLLGPVRRVQALATRGEDTRLITAMGPNQGTRFDVGTDTSLLSLLEFANGTTMTFGASWDVYRHSNHPIELHGTTGSLRLPDPDNFSGMVGYSDHGAAWDEIDTTAHVFGAHNWPMEAPDRANYRMLGLVDLAAALHENRTPRASGQLALHVLEVLEAILKSGETGQPQDITSQPDRPAALSEEAASAFRAE